MARNYANIVTAIWRHPEFRALDAREQRIYLLLVTQPNISAAGVLPLTVGRWATCAADTTPEQIRAGLTILQNRRFIVFDTSTEELLVRSFVRWDGGHTNPKRRPVIGRDARDVESATLRRSLAAEFNRLGLDTDGLSDSLSATQSGPVSEPILAEPESGFPPDFPSESAGHLTETSSDLFSQEDSLSGCLSDGVSPSDGVVVTEPLVVTTTHKPQTATQTQALGKAETLNQRANRIARIYTDEVKTSNFMATCKIVKTAIKDGYTDDQLIAALKEFVGHRGKTITATLMRLVLEGKPLADLGTVTPMRRSTPSRDIDWNAAMARAQAREAIA